MTSTEIYNKIIKQNGVEHQIKVCIEELAELTKELTKHIRNDTNENRMHLAEEIADVKICLEQLILYYNINNEIEFFKEFKLTRLLLFYIKDKTNEK